MAKKVRTTVECMACGKAMALSGRVEMWQIVNCPKCGLAMEVISVDPVEVDWFFGEPAYADYKET